MVKLKKAINGRVKLLCKDRKLLHFVKRRFTVKNPNYRYQRWGEKELSPISVVYTYPIGLTFDIMLIIKEYDPSIKIDISEIKDLIKPISFNLDKISDVQNSKYQYRDYQSIIIKSCLKFGRGLIESATSSGKSLMQYGILKNFWECMGYEARFLLIVPNIQLVVQMYEDFIEYGCDKDKICKFSSAGHRTMLDRPIIISNRDWLNGHKDELPDDIKILFVDEVHQCNTNNNITKFVRKIKTDIKFGFTGTLPNDKMSKWNVMGLFGPILKIKKAKDLQKEGYIAKTRIVSVRFNHNIAQPKIPSEYIDAIQKAKLQNNHVKIKVATMEAARQKFPAEWRYIEDTDWCNKFIIKMMNSFEGNTVLLYDHIEHGHILLELLKSIETNKKIFLIDGSIKVDDREFYRNEMELSNNCFLLGNTKCISTGINIKNINNVGFAFPAGKTSTKIIQSIGRGLRLMKGKSHVNIIDFHHNFKYSQEHYNERKKLYIENYTYDKIITRFVKVD